MPKPKIAFYWCASCGGCEEAVVDVAEAILELAEAVEIVLWPVALDFKRQDLEALPDGAIAAALVNGAIRTSEQEEMARLLRRKSGVVVAFGSCACTGGIPGLANQFTREEVWRYVYHDAPSVVNPEGTEPLCEYHDHGRTVTLPAFRHVVRTLDQVIDVDYYLPGCAPSSEMVLVALRAILAGELPPRGAVVGPDVALCDNCPRIETKPADLQIDQYVRTHTRVIDPEVCLLAQGFLCLGAATRAGCGERCIRGNMPCTGCYGPVSGVRDHGAKILAALTSILAARDEAGIDRALEGVPDPVGSFYRYGLAASLLRRRADLPTLAGGHHA